jgi:hypothetical protein
MRIQTGISSEVTSHIGTKINTQARGTTIRAANARMITERPHPLE